MPKKKLSLSRSPKNKRSSHKFENLAPLKEMAVSLAYIKLRKLDIVKTLIILDIGMDNFKFKLFKEFMKISDSVIYDKINKLLEENLIGYSYKNYGDCRSKNYYLTDKGVRIIKSLTETE